MIPVFAIDPGWMTGIIVGEYSDTTPLEVNRILQVDGGLEGVADDLTRLRVANPSARVVCERFAPRPMAGSYKLRELEPLRIEGFVRATWGPNVTWQTPSAMLIGGGKGPEGKRNADNILRAGKLWSTGKTVGQKDANDANAAMKHLLAFMRNIEHEPTIERYLK